MTRLEDDIPAKNHFVLPELVRPEAQRNGLDAPYWSALEQERLLAQRCRSCRRWQWGPEWICYRCQSFDIEWSEVPTTDGRYRGSVYSWQRVWHPTHPLLAAAVPYVIMLVELPTAGGIRMVGNLEGDPRAEVRIGAEADARFEHHEGFTLVHWAPTSVSVTG